MNLLKSLKLIFIAQDEIVKKKILKVNFNAIIFLKKSTKVLILKNNRDNCIFVQFLCKSIDMFKLKFLIQHS